MSAFIPTHLHLKSGGLYRVITRGHMEADYPATAVVVYGDTEGRVFVRPAAEFDDGRFEPVKDHSPDAGNMVPPADIIATIEAAIVRSDRIGQGFAGQAVGVFRALSDAGKLVPDHAVAAATVPPADLVKRVSDTLSQHIELFEGNEHEGVYVTGHDEAARAVIALFAEREKAAAGMLDALDELDRYSIGQPGYGGSPAADKVHAVIAAAKAAGIGGVA